MVMLNIRTTDAGRGDKQGSAVEVYVSIDGVDYVIDGVTGLRVDPIKPASIMTASVDFKLGRLG